MRPRHVPVRRCVVCGTHASKRELVRIVRTAEGQVLVDETSKQSGRGAYLCHNPECWRKAAQSDRLSNALRTNVDAEGRARLRSYAEALAAHLP